MIKTAIKDLQPGAVNAMPVFSKSGQMILPAHSLLTSQQISRLEFYGIEWVNIQEEPSDAEQITPPEQEEFTTYSQKLRKSKEFHMFKVDYNKKTNLLKSSINDVITKNADVDSNSLIQQVSSLYTNHLTSLSVFDMLHNMRQIDDSTFAHSVNVALISRMLGGWLHLSEDDLDILTLAGLLHDIGKCVINTKVLLKPGPLTPLEYAEVKRHPTAGAKLLASQSLDSRIQEAALMHHERCDGSGYPSGLQRTEISEFAKILAIADVYDAMTSNRCYRKGLCPFEVIATFEREGLEKYETEYILTFLTHIIDSYMGNSVLLNDGSIGNVLMINQRRLSRPLIRLTNNEYIDLMKRPDLHIQAII
ncbi:MAG: HD-GYP domain-containing protein [Lachnospiraceae bacterium]|jgi:putative nucleotidyltransferase with HDIG domain|nr:HD-GYP domain-containing protein [Lachnospiraceae bacterium]